MLDYCSIELPQEFTLKGLEDHVISFLDEESYCDASFYDIFTEFTDQLVIKSKSISQLLESWGTGFHWEISSEEVLYAPNKDWDSYKYKNAHGVVYYGVEAILAFLRDDIDIPSLVDNYWSNRNHEYMSGEVAGK